MGSFTHLSMSLAAGMCRSYITVDDMSAVVLSLLLHLHLIVSDNSAELGPLRCEYSLWWCHRCYLSRRLLISTAPTSLVLLELSRWRSIL